MDRSTTARALLLTVGLLLTACTAATPAPVPQAASAPPGWGEPPQAELPAADRQALQEVLDAAVAGTGSADPAGVTAAVVGSEGAWAGAAGTGGDGAPLVPEAVMAIASITKTFTAAEVLHLAETGQVDLDAPASRYLRHPLLAREPTVRDLLAMRSAIPECTRPELPDLLGPDPTVHHTAEECLALAPGEPGEPGLDFAYTNSNYLLLGLLIERVSGLPYAAALRRDVLAGLGGRLAVQDAEAPPPPLAAPGPSPLGTPDGRYLPNRAVASIAGAAGGMAADAATVARWGYLLYGGSVLPPSTVAAMTEAGPNQGYGLGAERDNPAGLGWSSGHSGGIDGYRTLLRVFDDRRLAVAVLIPDDADPRPVLARLVLALDRP